MKMIHKASAAIVAGLLMVGNAVPALAVDPSTGDQTGTGSTDVTVISKLANQEVGGTTDPNNTDGNDPDTLGDNIAFSVPSSINFVVDAQGVLTGPAADSTYIENKSSFGIRASSFDVDPGEGWTIEAQGAASHGTNAANFQFGPTGNLLDAATFLNKTDIPTTSAAQWNMGPDDSTGATNRVKMASSGHLYNVNKDLATAQKIAIIKTYVKIGNAS